MILCDTNILIDVMESRSQESIAALEHALRTGGAAINQIILAELLGKFPSPLEMADKIPTAIRRVSLPWNASAIAARAFIKYRRDFDGPKLSPLPDFFIGAHAEAAGIPLLTRDHGRYTTYFPTVTVINPSSDKK